jgi:hypothetical protein
MIVVENNSQFAEAIKNKKTVIALRGEFSNIVLSETYDNLHIYAGSSITKRLKITGKNITWYGGQIEASGGDAGNGPGGYGIHLVQCENVDIIGVTIRNANRGVAASRGLNWSISNCDFSVRQDGIIADNGSNIRFINNSFHNFRPQTGDHSDAIQIRNGMKNLIIAGNKVEGVSQGIGQMDATNDAPLENVMVIGNDVRVKGFHSITIQRCSGLQVIGNTTQQLTGRRSPLRLDPAAIVRDNTILSP